MHFKVWLITYHFLLQILIIAGFSVGVLSQTLPSPPLFSETSGLYEDSFVLEITSVEEDVEILYTLDGSEPNPDHIGGVTYTIRNSPDGPFETRTMETFVYNSPISIQDRSHLPNNITDIPIHYSRFFPPPNSVAKGTAVRAVAARNGELSEIVSSTYFVGEQFQEFNELPILSVIVQEDHFWGYEYGINVPGINYDPSANPVWFNNGNYFERGREWERPIHIEFFDEQGETAFSQNAGIRIHGGTSRYMVNRSFRVYARSDYGKSTIEYPIFPNRGPQVHKRLKLRMSGQDHEYTYFRDALMSILMLGTEVTVEDYRPVNLFINGEFWGITNIRERFDHHYVERNFGIPRDEVEILSGGADNHYGEYLDFIYNTSPDTDDFSEQVQNWINLDSFLDLKIAEIFFGRWDMHWEHWRDGRDPDSKWRWVLWDFDVGMSLPGYPPTLRNDWTGTDDHSVQTDYLKPFLTDYRTGGLNREFSTIMKNEDIRNRFLIRLALMMNSNLSSPRILSEINRMRQQIEPVMPFHIDRWSGLDNRIGSMDNWYGHIDHIRKFSMARQQHVYQQAVDLFELSGTATLEIEWDHEKGVVLIEEMPAHRLFDVHGTGSESDGSWEGELFRDIPVRISAEPDAGYQFAGWAGSVDSDEYDLVIHLDGDWQLSALFEPVEQFPGDDINPEPHILAEGDYLFDSWSGEEPEGSFPANMIFLQSNINDPGLLDPVTIPYAIPFENEADHDYHEDDEENIGFPYRLTRRTRINALGDRGISMINTGRGRDLGGVVLALDTRDVDQASLSWTAETIEANSRVYHVRLKYRTGIQSEWADFNDQNGNVVEYQRDDTGNETHFVEIPLPDELLGQPYIQLKWKYYFTGERLSSETGQRDEIRIDNIRVGTILDEPKLPDGERIVNYPNPFSGSTTVQYSTNRDGPVTISIYNLIGQRAGKYSFDMLSAGEHAQSIDFSALSSGTYFIRIITPDGVDVITVQHLR